MSKDDVLAVTKRVMLDDTGRYLSDVHEVRKVYPGLYDDFFVDHG